MDYHLIPTPGPAPEDVVVGTDGMLYAGQEDGCILRINPDSEEITVVARVPGRPLGLEPLPDGRLLVCNSPEGLMRVDPVTGDFERLVSEINGQKLIFASNVIADPDGTVHFTASSMRYTQPQWKRDLIEAIPTGHLCRLTPDGELTVLANDLHFANGLVRQGDDLIVAETAARRLTRFAPDGSRSLFCDLPGYPDNLGLGADGTIWVALPTRLNPSLERLRRAPGFMRRLAARLPDSVQPRPAPLAWIAGVSPQGEIVREFLWEDGGYGFVTGVCQHRGRLWCGSLSEPGLLTVTL